MIRAFPTSRSDVHLRIDLHSHSTVSDGSLTPGDLVRRAAACGVGVLALTDHDDVAGIAPAREAAGPLGLELVAGVEISVSWRGRTIHVLGLRIDPDNAGLCQGLAAIRDGRVERAGRMAAELERCGIPGALEGAYAHANEHIISRTHFARFLVGQGLAKDVRSVFKKFLKPGKPGYVRHEWAGLDQALAWIAGAGGVAVLAHPGRYDVGVRVMRDLIEEFKALGGVALEVISGSHGPEDNLRFARLVREYGLRASAGSDYHGPDHSYFDLGRLPELPIDLVPLWQDW